MKSPPFRAAVAMSGGVDSTVAAALLKQYGADVIGLTMDHLQGVPSAPPVAENAARAAHTVGIPHEVIDCQREFEAEVTAPFIAAYCHGRTPNPCVRCNQSLKFGRLLREARQRDCDYIATGHYAVILADRLQHRYSLHESNDRSKTQAYFLYTLTQNVLAATLFPLNSLTKTESRRAAAELGLQVTPNQGSQDICFIPNGDYRTFLRSRGATAPPGNIVHLDGRVLGRHSGITRYTVGQRRGLGVSHPSPLYVVGLDPIWNEVIVGERETSTADHIQLREFNRINPDEPVEGRSFSLRLRYQGAPVSGRILETAGPLAEARTDRPHPFIAPGQSLVLYEGDRVVGGGIIDSASLAG